MLVEFLETLTESPSAEDVWNRLVDKMAEYGFDRLIYGYTQFRSERSLGDIEDFLILSNHSREFLDRFLGDKLYFNAPMVRWALENDGARSWRHIEEQMERGELSPEEIAVYEFNRKMGITTGYALSFHTVSQRAKGGLALTAKAGLTHDDVDEIWAEHGANIKVICNVAHLKLINLPYSGLRRPLTKRQREALEWVGNGKTMQDIATIMDLKPATVEKHLRLAREVLDVDTTAQAVLKAAFQNQIFMLDPDK